MLENFMHLLFGTAGLVFFIGAFYSSSMINASPTNRLVQSLAMGLIFCNQVMTSFDVLSSASSAAIFDAAGSALGIAGCIRLLLSLEVGSMRVTASK